MSLRTKNKIRYNLRNHASRLNVTICRLFWKWYRILGLPVFLLSAFIIGTTFRQETTIKIESGPALDTANHAILTPLIPDNFIHVSELQPAVSFSNFVPVTADDRAVVKYVNRFKKVARAEHERFGIPASIKLAQAINESNAGRSQLAVKNNNHFGIKCFSKTCKKGHCSNFEDDTHKDFFLIYKTAWESWRGHSMLLMKDRYKPCFKHKNDYVNWARELKKCGYATNKDYPKLLIDIVEKYGLTEFDKN